MTSLHTEPTAILQPSPPQAGSTQAALAHAHLPPVANSPQRFQQKISLRALVMGLFMIPLMTAVGFTTWFSIRNSRESVNNLSQQLQTEVGNRVSAHLDYYLNVPKQINQINVDAKELGLLNLQDFNTAGTYFWRQMQVLDIGYISYANQQGEFIGVERLDDGKLLINEVSQAATQGQLYVYQTNDRGDRNKRLEKKTYDPRTEAWYSDAVRANQPVWSKIYQWEDKPEVLSVSSSYPVYDDDQKLIGVIGIDLILSQISQFLNQLQIGASSRVFIAERNGLLVGNSGTARAYTVSNGKPQRVNIANSSDALIKATGQHVQTDLGGFDNIQATQLSSFNFEGQKRFVHILPWQDDLGLDWRIVVVTSESDFMAQINANTRNTILFSGVALLVAIVLGLLASRWITHPVIRLSQASQAIAQGDLDQTVETGGIGELGVLAQSFNQMVQQLRSSFIELEATNRSLEERVAERTATLQSESQALSQEVEHLLQVVSAVEEGDLTAEAEVSPRVTGLVADTLNRLIERLSQIMTVVLSTAEQVTLGAEHLEQLSLTVAYDAQQQTQAVVQVQELMENVNLLSEDAVIQAVATSEAVELTRSAIDQGRQEISAMTQGIYLLQQDTQQIVKRTQTLSNYVELAAQFTKDQKQIAAMTRILAVNASMLANRASAQQDPEQMAVIAREFETIAAQVNQLASQTNQSLALLQQRTDQMQTVASGLNHDVQGISQQVSYFTTGVEHSQQAFNTIQAVSERVANMGARVTQSSQVIVNASKTTLQSVRQISTIAVEASERANITQEQAQHMEQIARTLLQKVAFFRLQSEVEQPLPSLPAIAPTVMS
ncbi:MAG TPA: HAMP domain-containing protein [Coleofasciculaceae cyanobacterium]|jgi:methyl-accepting chemotaxis protein